MAYFLFQLGGFAAFAFIGKWMTDSFRLSLDQVGNMMVFLGLGNLSGSFSGAYIVKKFTSIHTIFGGILILVVIYIVLPHISSVSTLSGFLFLIFAILGVIFPLMMGLLISLNPAIRGTISSLANSTMYTGATLGSWIAGELYARFNGFSSVGLFTALCFAASLLTFILSGALAVNAESKKNLAS